MLAIYSPFAPDKNLGKAYNEAMRGLNPGDWMCFKDLDVCFFKASHVRIIYDYIKELPEAGILTCRTNRIHPLAPDQLINGEVSEKDFRHHYTIADRMEQEPLDYSEIKKEISGFLMVFKYETWVEVGGFSENMKCLGVDNDFSLKVIAAKKKIYRMDRLYVWHTYRWEDIKDKSHLL